MLLVTREQMQGVAARVAEMDEAELDDLAMRLYDKGFRYRTCEREACELLRFAGQAHRNVHMLVEAFMTVAGRDSGEGLDGAEDLRG